MLNKNKNKKENNGTFARIFSQVFKLAILTVPILYRLAPAISEREKKKPKKMDVVTSRFENFIFFKK